MLGIETERVGFEPSLRTGAQRANQLHYAAAVSILLPMGRIGFRIDLRSLGFPTRAPVGFWALRDFDFLCSNPKFRAQKRMRQTRLAGSEGSAHAGAPYALTQIT